MSDYRLITDEALLKAAALKDSGALESLYDRYGRLVYSLALRMTGNTALAEEITQDVYIQVWNKAHTYHEERGKVITWVMSITRHRVIDLIRQQKSRPQEVIDGWDDAEDRFASEETLENGIALKQQSQRVRKALAQLPLEQRKVLALAFFRGLSHQEIANVVHEPLGTVKTRIRLAMQKLRQELSQEL